MSFECLKCDGRRRVLNRDWKLWLEEADRWYLKYRREVEESPFEFHEVATVGFLSCAAARAGFLTLNEYELQKQSQKDRRVKVWGRADLWMLRRTVAYSFEFKRAWHEATLENLEESFALARGDITVVPKDECHHAAAGLSAYVTDKKRWQSYLDFAESNTVTSAYRIGPKGVSSVFLYFWIKG